MRPPFRPLAIAAMFHCSSAVPTAHAGPAAWDSLNLLDQADALPEDFRDHFFDVPLVLRVERDGQYLGDARALLSRDNRLQLLDFIDSQDSRLPASERERWLAVLAEPRLLGPCGGRCDSGLIQLHYSLESSLLSIATRDAERATDEVRHYALPEAGSRGLIVRHQMNLYGGEGAPMAGRYALDAQGSLGNWTTVARYQVDRNGERERPWRQAMQSLYAQREYGDHFMRAGYFLPSFQGVTRQPRAPGAVSYATLGIMAGSSDSLAVDGQMPSVYPVYVTANREGSVEVYRDGSLILSQALQPGVQQLDTRRLPGGIYAVELRVIEDGRETSRETTLIHKPMHWRDPRQRWRYSAFAGVQSSLFDSFVDPDNGKVAVGGVLNYLVHPRAVVGVSAQQIGEQRALATSVDWQASDRASLYSNLYVANQSGSGVDLQGLLRYRNGSVVLSHNRTWQERRRIDDDRFTPVAELPQTRAGWLHSSAIGVNHRLGDAGNLAARASWNRGVSNGAGLDVSYSNRQTLFGMDGTWRASVFDRPGNTSTGQRRNRGVEFTVNLALGQNGRHYSGSLGSRTGRQGGRGFYASAGVQQQRDDSWLRSVGGQATMDGDGIALSGNTQFQQRMLRGDAYAQRVAGTGRLAGGLNLESMMAMGGGRLSVAGEAQGGSVHTGMILDVDSEMPGVALRAHDSRGGSYLLRPGRNFLPVAAYRHGNVQIDFDGRDAPAATIQPAAVPYHLNKGGVAYAKVAVVGTLTVMGHLRDAQGRPLAGAHVINHAGRSVSEVDGFFVLEMSAKAPALQVRHPRVSGCSFALDGKITRPGRDAWMAGILQCPSVAPRLAGATP